MEEDIRKTGGESDAENPVSAVLGKEAENAENSTSGMAAPGRESDADFEKEFPVENPCDKEYGLQEPGAKKKKDKKKRGGFLPGFVCGAVVVFAALALIGRFGGTDSADTQEVASSEAEVEAEEASILLDEDTTEKIELLAEYLETYYYEEIDEEDLREGLYAGLFTYLDSYSVYYTEEEFEELYSSTLEGTYCGIGATLQQDSETMLVTIISIYEGSPAEEVGLQVGDIIYEVDEYDATSMDVTELVTHIRGEENTTVHIVIYRDGETLEFDVERRNLTIPTVAYDMLDGNTGYIEVSEFTDSTTEQFADALEELESEGMESLIIDLRANPGGVLDACCDMLDMILDEGLLVYTEDKNGDREEYYSTSDEYLEVPLVVLVDSNSASASEIFAGAVQDRGAGTIVGTVTYGKGIVQSVLSLSDGSGFKMTTHTYYTPGGTCIDGIGITPDVEIEYEFLGGEDDSYSYEFDNQIQKALEILQGE